MEFGIPVEEPLLPEDVEKALLDEGSMVYPLNFSDSPDYVLTGVLLLQLMPPQKGDREALIRFFGRMDKVATEFQNYVDRSVAHNFG